jgi:hypothetical protein
MPKLEAVRRIILFVSASLLLMALLYFGGVRQVAPDTLPARLTDKEFWKMVTDFSESGGYFRSDNFLSNETGYQAVIPFLRKTIQPGGVYMGVGPEQNFTYLIAVEPKLAFVIDIRRQNMLEHLLYKALMEISADRAEFLSRLFSRPRPPVLNASSSAESLFREYENAQSSRDLFDTNLRGVLDHLEKKKGFALSGDDEEAVLKVYRAFFDSGPELSYTFVGGYGGFMTMPTYADLMTENDGRTHNWNYLATEDQFRKVQRLQNDNLIVPLVGDFAGPTAIRSVGQYLKQHGATVTAFYTSNVEQYLFQDDNSWNSFYANVGTLPLNSSSTFVRYVLSRGFNRRSRTVLSSMTDVVRAYHRGKINSYYDIVEMTR